MAHHRFLSGGGEAAALIAAFDWSRTALGPIDGWAPPLTTTLALILRSPVPIVTLWGEEGVMLYNDAYSVFAGARHPELLGMKVREAWAEVADFNDNVMNVCLAGGTLAYKDQELTLYRSGRPDQVWLDLDYSPVPDERGVAIGVMAIVVETTEIRRTAERLRRSEEQLRLATEAADIGLWDLDPAADTLFWPPIVKAMFGISAEQPISMADFYAGLHPDDLDRTTQAFAAALDPDRRAKYDVEYRTVGKEDGKVRWVTAKGRGIFDDRGVCLRAVGTAIDISRSKAIEERLRELNDHLEQRVEAEVAKRAEAEEQLRQSQKLEAIGQLTGGVAHDFNNLLTVIRGSVDMLRRPDLPDEKRLRYIDAIGSTADRAAGLTGQLLAFARRQTLQPTRFDAGRSLSEVADVIRTLAGSRIAVDMQLPEEPCFILADRGQFDTAVINLGINARDAMRGEGRLTVATGPVSGIPAIRSHPPVAGDFVAVTIADTGTGIGQGDLARIFEPFFTTKEVGKGTGLGLSQVIGFAKQSGGDIRVDSAQGVGTTFTLYLPRSHWDSSEPAQEAEIELPVDGAGLCVLLVEDNEQVGEFATSALNELGYDSVLAIDGERALAALARDRGRFQVVFSDVVMPGMSGLELSQEIRRLYPGLPVVLTSGYSHVLAQNGNHGFELLHKPYSVEQLSRALRKAAAWEQDQRRQG